MAKIILPDKQTCEFPDDIASDDKLLRESLISFVPEIANADLKRATVGGVMTVSVIKKSGTKGAAILDVLDAAPEKINPAVAMQRRLQQAEADSKLSVSDLLQMRGEIEKAIDAGNKEISRVSGALKVLKGADAQPAKTVPVGF
jgi:hypothetical protein